MSTARPQLHPPPEGRIRGKGPPRHSVTLGKSLTSCLEPQFSYLCSGANAAPSCHKTKGQNLVFLNLSPDRAHGNCENICTQGVPAVAQWKEIRLVSMRMRVCSRTAVNYSVGRRQGSDPAALIQPLAWEFPNASGVALKRKKKKKKKKERKKIFAQPLSKGTRLFVGFLLPLSPPSTQSWRGSHLATWQDARGPRAQGLVPKKHQAGASAPHPVQDFLVSSGRPGTGLRHHFYFIYLFIVATPVACGSSGARD